MGIREMIYEARRAKIREERTKQAFAGAVGLLTGALVGILLAPQSGEETREQIVNATKDAGNLVAEKSKQAGRYVSDKANQVYEVIMEKSGEYGDVIKEKYQGLKSNAMTELRPVAEAAEELKDDAKKELHEKKEDAKEKAEEVKDKAKAVKEDVKEGAEKVKKDVQETAKEVKKDIKK